MEPIPPVRPVPEAVGFRADRILPHKSTPAAGEAHTEGGCRPEPTPDPRSACGVRG